MKHFCKFCGSAVTEVIGGDNGDPFDQSPERIFCRSCGRSFSTAEASAQTIPTPLNRAECLLRGIPRQKITLKKKPVIRVQMVATGAGLVCDEQVVFPYADGVYALSGYAYPFCRYQTLCVRGDTVELDGEISKLTEVPLITEKHYTAYAPDKHPEAEKIVITITVEYQ